MQGKMERIKVMGDAIRIRQSEIDRILSESVADTVSRKKAAGSVPANFTKGKSEIA